MTEKSIKNLSFYVKDISFESPSAPMIFRGGFQPQINLQVEVKNTPHPDNLYEVGVEITAEAKGKDDQVGFIIEVEQAGLFEITGFEGDELKQILSIYCPTQVFPYIRQVVDQLLISGGFPPLALAPINFEQMSMRPPEEGAENNK